MNFVLVVGGIVFLIIVYFLLTVNSFVKLENRVKEAFATMDVYLKKRFDLIPNLVEVVKEYTKYESETIEEIINKRNSYDSLTVNEKLKTNVEVSSQISRLLMLFENYPDLKASDNYLNLSKNLSNVENEIADSRKYYNALVRMFNDKVEMFPSNMVAKVMKYKSKLMFKAMDEEKNNVSVNL